MEQVSLSSEQLYVEIEKNGPKVKDELIGNPYDFIGDSVRRPTFTWNYSWAIPSLEAIKEIADFIGDETCLEVGSGKGLWAYLLNQAGVNIIATDPQTSHNISPFASLFSNSIEDGKIVIKGATGSEGCPHDVINQKTVQFCQDDFYKRIGVSEENLKPLDRLYYPIEKLDYQQALSKYKDASCLFICWGYYFHPYDEFTGNKIIFIGEAEGGCTSYPPDEEKWTLVKRIKIPKWSGIRDFLGLYERKVSP